MEKENKKLKEDKKKKVTNKTVGLFIFAMVFINAIIVLLLLDDYNIVVLWLLLFL